MHHLIGGQNTHIIGSTLTSLPVLYLHFRQDARARFLCPLITKFEKHHLCNRVQNQPNPTMKCIWYKATSVYYCQQNKTAILTCSFSLALSTLVQYRIFTRTVAWILECWCILTCAAFCYWRLPQAKRSSLLTLFEFLVRVWSFHSNSRVSTAYLFVVFFEEPPEDPDGSVF